MAGTFKHSSGLLFLGVYCNKNKISRYQCLSKPFSIHPPIYPFIVVYYLHNKLIYIINSNYLLSSCSCHSLVLAHVFLIIVHKKRKDKNKEGEKTVKMNSLRDCVQA